MAPVSMLERITPESRAPSLPAPTHVADMMDVNDDEEAREELEDFYASLDIFDEDEEDDDPGL